MEGNDKKVMTTGEPPEIEAWIGFSQAAAAPEEEEASTLVNLRPNSFAEYIGQERVKENLLIACNAASNRKEPLDHVLLHGPPGLGKTSLARVIATQLGVGMKSTAGPVLERPGDLAAVLTALAPNDVLFIDEIHRLPRAVEEVLYPAMEDYRIDIIIGQGPAARSIKLDLKPFTLIGATTRTGLLTSPLRDRFGLVHRLEFYTKQQLSEIIKRSADLLGVPIDPLSCAEIATKARGTPRIANRLLKRVRDFAQERTDGVISPSTVLQALAMLNIDNLGLDQMDRSFLTVMIERFNGGPVGIDALAATLGEDRETLEEVYEPFLLQLGLIIRGRRGREVTESAYKHLNIKPRPGNMSLFESQ